MLCFQFFSCAFFNLKQASIDSNLAASLRKGSVSLKPKKQRLRIYSGTAVVSSVAASSPCCCKAPRCPPTLGCYMGLVRSSFRPGQVQRLTSPLTFPPPTTRLTPASLLYQTTSTPEKLNDSAPFARQNHSIAPTDPQLHYHPFHLEPRSYPSYPQKCLSRTPPTTLISPVARPLNSSKVPVAMRGHKRCKR